MTRSIVAGARVFPRGRLGDMPVEGPDEDAFTLAVEALESLVWEPEDPPLGRLHLVGPFAKGVESDFPDALGRPKLHFLRHSPGPPGLWAAIEAASTGAEEAGSDAVAVLDRGELSVGEPPLDRGTQMFAFGLSPRAGFRLVRRMFTTGSFTGAEAASAQGPRSAEGSGKAASIVAPIFVSRPGHLKAGSFAAAELEPGSSRHDRTLPSLLLAPIMPIVDALRKIEVPSDSIVSAAIVDRHDRGMIIAIVEASRTFSWAEGPSDVGMTYPTDPAALLRRREPAPNALSEGAYLPKPTYVEHRPSRWRLAADECGACQALTFPIRGSCRQCGRRELLRRLELPRTGLPVEAVTTIHPGAQPTEFDPQVGAAGAYSVVVARAGPSVRITAQVTDAQSGAVAIGDHVDLKLRRTYPLEGDWRYSLKAIPVAAGAPLPAP